MKRIIAVFLTFVMLTGVIPAFAADEVHDDTAFIHPGVLNTEADLERIAKAVKSGEEPYLSGYNALISNSYAQIAAPRAAETITRGGSGANFALLYQDAARAYLCAVRWKISGETAYADCSRDILNAWSGTLKTVTGNADRYLTAIYSYQLAAAAELMRDYPGFKTEQMQDMLISVFYKPLTERFLYSGEYGKDHNDAHVMNYWANWDLCNMAAAMAIGVFCDRRDIYERAIEYYKFGAGNGSIFNAVPKLYEAGEATLNVPVGQWQEAGRDMEHTQLGLGLMAVMCEIAWNQGDDLYGWANNRFMYGAEYVAQYHIGQDVPFTEYNWYSGNPGKWSSQTIIAGTSGIRPVFEMIYNHYKNRKGLDAPGMEALLEAARPEGGPGGHASSFDQPGFGTLLYTRDPYDTTEAVLGESNVKEGIYRITSRLSGKALTEDADGYVKQYALDEDNENQLWKLCDLGGGIYKLINIATGNTMCVEDDSYSLGAKITTGSYEGRFAQQFAFLRFDDEGAERRYYEGYYRIVPVGSGLSLDVMNFSQENSADIIQYTYNSGRNQQWELTRVDPYPEQQRPDREITFVNESTACFYAKESARAIIAKFDEAENLISVETKTVTGEEMIQFTPPASGKVKLMLWDDELEPLTASEEKVYIR